VEATIFWYVIGLLPLVYLWCLVEAELATKLTASLMVAVVWGLALWNFDWLPVAVVVEAVIIAVVQFQDNLTRRK
jgi:hypothetical protein